MVSTRGRNTGKGNPPPSPENINGKPAARDKRPAVEADETPATQGQDAYQPVGSPVSGGVTRVGQPDSPVAAVGGGAGGAGEMEVPRKEGEEEGKEARQEETETSPNGDEKSLERPADEKLKGGHTDGGAGVGGEESRPAEKAATSATPDGGEKSVDKLGSQQPSGAAKEQQRDGPAREPGGDGMDVVVEEPKPTAMVGQVDSSDEEDDDDGFKVVVGREVAPAPTPVVPTKRFLRGTNALVNTATTTSGAAGAKESGTSSTKSSKPVSAAAGIASLVPSKGAPVAAARPSLKPGEYPPTAELQQSTGKTAFDVDIDGMEEQPWRHPGVDIADFFNYGFTEDSWRVYCEKQLRNRYDRTRGRPKITTSSVGGRGGGNAGGSGSHMRHGGGDRPNSLQPPRPPQPSQMHTNNGPAGPNSFRPLGPAGNNGAWAGGAGPERFPASFGNGPPGHGNGSPPWFEGQQQQQQQQQMQMQLLQQQMHTQNRQHFAPGAGPGGGAMGPGGGGMNNGRTDPAGMRRSRSPDPRGGQLENKMPRLR